MKTLTKNLVLFVLFTLPFCQIIPAQQIEPPERKFEFVTSDEYETLDPSIKEYIGNTLPTHVAIMELPNIFGPGRNNETINIIQLPMRGAPIPRDLYSCILKSDTSSKLSEFMCLRYVGSARNNGTINYIYYIYANSDQQARKYAEAFIKGFDIGTYNRLKQLKDDLEYNQKIIRDGEVVISKMEVEHNELEAQKNKLYKEYAKANYLSEETIPEVNDIIKVKEELAHSLREVDFELVGLDAKIESVNKYKLSGTIIDDETLIKLNQILMATDIERAGVLARKQAFETSFKQTNQLYNLILSGKKTLNDLNIYKNRFKSAPALASRLEIELKNPREYNRYIQVEDNKIVIKPVKQD